MSDDLTDILGEAFATYSGDRIKPGVVCVAVIPYVMDRFFAIRPLDVDPASEAHHKYQLVEKTAATLAGGDQATASFPCKDLNLGADEDLVVVKVKRRPVVVLSRAIVTEREIDPSRFQDSFWCAPCYTLVDKLMHPQFAQEVVEDILALKYRCCFPLPYDPYLHDRESVLRLDRMQPIQRRLLKPIERRLSKKWTACIREWVRFYVTGGLGDEDTDKNPASIASCLKVARELLMEQLARRRGREDGG